MCKVAVETAPFSPGRADVIMKVFLLRGRQLPASTARRSRQEVKIGGKFKFVRVGGQVSGRVETFWSWGETRRPKNKFSAVERSRVTINTVIRVAVALLVTAIYKRWWRWSGPEEEERRFRNGPELPFGCISKPDSKQKLGIIEENDMASLTKRERATVTRIIREKYGLQEPKKSKLAIKLQKESAAASGLSATGRRLSKKELAAQQREWSRVGPFIYPKTKRKGGYYPRTLFDPTTKIDYRKKWAEKLLLIDKIASEEELKTPGGGVPADRLMRRERGGSKKPREGGGDAEG